MHLLVKFFLFFLDLFQFVVFIIDELLSEFDLSLESVRFLRESLFVLGQKSLLLVQMGHFGLSVLKACLEGVDFLGQDSYRLFFVLS